MLDSALLADVYYEDCVKRLVVVQVPNVGLHDVAAGIIFPHSDHRQSWYYCWLWYLGFR